MISDIPSLTTEQIEVILSNCEILISDYDDRGYVDILAKCRDAAKQSYREFHAGHMHVSRRLDELIKSGQLFHEEVSPFANVAWNFWFVNRECADEIIKSLLDAHGIRGYKADTLQQTDLGRLRNLFLWT